MDRQKWFLKVATTMENKITLSAPELEDLDFLYELENNQKLWKYSQTRVPISKTTLKAYLENISKEPNLYADQIRFIIKNKDRNIGCIDLFEIDNLNKKAGVGICILETHRNKGYAKQALEQILTFSGEHLMLNQIYAETLVDNIGSSSLFEACKFERVAELKQWRQNQHGFQDVYLYQFLLSS
jgi:diamine N-acetyltransferase